LCHRAKGYIASRILTQNGYDNVFNLSGGFKTYSAATCLPVANQIFGIRVSSGDVSDLEK